jgi:hypothetical protein
MMFSFTTCHFVLFSFLSLSGNAETVRGGSHRELQVVEPPVDLGTAGDFVILAKAGISTVPASIITGDIGVSPIAGTAMTGFSLIADSSGTFSTSAQVYGQCFASNYISPTPSKMTTAVSDMETAYTDAGARPTTTVTVDSPAYGNLEGGLIGGQTLTTGVYTFETDISITSNVIFDATGSASPDTDRFILQTTGNVIIANGASVTLAGGALASNIVWQVAGFVELGANTHMEGILLVKTQANFQAGSSLNGRVLSQTAVTLISTTITEA